jgi:hypothetical protein
MGMTQKWFMSRGLVKNTPPPTTVVDDVGKVQLLKEDAFSPETGIRLLCPKFRIGCILDSSMCFHIGESEMVHIMKPVLQFNDHPDKRFGSKHVLQTGS